MIGPILNMLNDVYNKSYSIVKANSFNPNSNIFGNGTVNATLEKSMDSKELFKKYNTFEFHNLTIPTSCVLKPHRTSQTELNIENYLRQTGLPPDTPIDSFLQWALSASWDVLSHKTNYHTLYLKCSGTLTVNGAITAQGCGGSSVIAGESDRTFYQPIEAPISIKTDYGVGNSAAAENYYRLYEFGKNGNFFRYPNSLFLVGAGGSGRRYYKKHWKVRKRWLLQYGFSCGGYGGPLDGGGGENVHYGGGGGFLALYFRKLYINGKEYGKEHCDISKISANGYWMGNTDQNMGGGCMVIAADTIKIGSRGTINCDSNGGKTTYSIYPVANSYYAENSYNTGRGSGSYIKPSFLNNLPALCERQTGIKWNPDTYQFERMRGSDPYYYFDDGLGGGVPNYFMEYQNWAGVGGAGIALGYKIGD